MPRDPKSPPLLPGGPPELPPLVENLPMTEQRPRNTLPPMQYRLRMVHEHVWTVDLVGDAATVGCGDATIRIPEEGGVSRIHLKLFLQHGRWSFEDVSTNGTYELDSHGKDTGQLVHGVSGWAPGRGYRVGGTELWMQLIPTAEEVRRGFHGLIGESAAMQGLKAQIERAGPRPATVILHGETGTGKEVAAHAIHALSNRHLKEMRSVNCAEFKGELASTALFGCVRGAYTGAEDRMGAFEAAHGSTLFLDEVAELPLPAQAELLRVIENGRFRRVGGTEEVAADVRLIVASHKHLGDEVCKGNFREDLHSRLDVVTIRLPTLAERLEDLPLLVEHFARMYDPEGRLTWSKAALQAIKANKPPHNLRGLRNLVNRTQVMLAPGVQVIEPEHLLFSDPFKPSTGSAGPLIAADDLSHVYLPGKKLKELKLEILQKALARHPTQAAAAEELDINRVTFSRNGLGGSGEREGD